MNESLPGINESASRQSQRDVSAMTSWWKSCLGLGSLFEWPALQCSIQDKQNEHAHAQSFESAASPHIHRSKGSINSNHIAYEYLHATRDRDIGIRAIDDDGNFVKRSDTSPWRSDPANKQRAKRSTLHLGDGDEDTFAPWWEQEFLEMEYRFDVFAKWLSYAFFIGLQASISWIMAPLGSMPEHCPVNSWFAGDSFHRFLATLPHIVINSASLVLRIIVMHVPEGRRVVLYPKLVLCWVICLFSTYSYVGGVRELARGLGGPSRLEGLCGRTSHVEIHLDYSTWIPTRTCVDHDQRRTVTQWPFVMSAGCDSMLPDATIPRAIEFQFVFYFMRCSWRTALTGTAITSTLLVLAAYAVGGSGRSLGIE